MRRITAITWVLAMVAIALQAAALCTQYFQPWLDGDYLYPQRFAEDVLAGVYPLSGWTLSSAPYFFPDFSGVLLLSWMRPTMPSLSLYVICFYVILGLVVGWSLGRVGWREWNGWLAGAVLINALLACREITDHARILWWLGTPGFHGGAVLLGFAQFALWAGPAEALPSARRSLAGGLLLIVGLISDTLLFTQFLVPLGVALAVGAGNPLTRSGWKISPRFRRYATVVVVGLLSLVVWRLAMALSGWWKFSHVFRHAPWPSAIARTAGKFVQDLFGELGQMAAVFIGLTCLTTFLAIYLAWKRRREEPSSLLMRRQAACFALASMVTTVLLPICAVYWQNAQNGRYLLPFLIVPGWLLLAMAPSASPNGSRGWTGLALLGILLVGGTASRAIDTTKWNWPYPTRVQELDGFLKREGLTRGFADYWNANLLNRLTRAEMRLGQLRPDGRVQFWNNNAFHFYDIQTTDSRLKVPKYNFIVMENLTSVAIAQKFGEPSKKQHVAGYEIWLYDVSAAARLTALVELEIGAFLQGRPGVKRIADQ